MQQNFADNAHHCRGFRNLCINRMNYCSCIAALSHQKRTSPNAPPPAPQLTPVQRRNPQFKYYRK